MIDKCIICGSNDLIRNKKRGHNENSIPNR